MSDMCAQPGLRVRCVRRVVWTTVDGQEWAGPAYGSRWTVKRVSRQRWDGELHPFIDLLEWEPWCWWGAANFVVLGEGEMERLRRIAEKAAPVLAYSGRRG